MPCHRIVITFLLTVAGIATTSVAAESAGDPLLRYVPADANAIVYADIQALLASPLAQREFWKEQMQLHNSERAIVLPPQASKCVMAANLDMATLDPTWEVVMMHVPDAPTLDQIAQREGGRTDTFDNLQAAWSPRNLYVVEARPDTFVLHWPGERQAVHRWLRESGARTTHALSPYLSRGIDIVKAGKAQIAVLLDLEGVVSAGEIRPDLEEFESLKASPVDRDALAVALADLRGISLEVEVQEQAQSRLTFSFGRNMAIVEPVAKDFVTELLQRRGAFLAELPSWTATVRDKDVVLEGAITPSGLRRVTSLFDVAAPDLKKAAKDKQGDKSTDAGEPADMANASLRHFRAVRAYLDDVKGVKNQERMSDAAVWVDRYARKIEQLPILNVDPELQEFSGFVAARLRQAAARLKQVNTNSKKRMAAHSNFYNTQDTGGNPTVTIATKNYSSSGYYRDRTTDYHEEDVAVERYRLKYQEGERKQVRMEEEAGGTEAAVMIMNELEDETARVRRVMTNRYKIEF